MSLFNQSITPTSESFPTRLLRAGFELDKAVTPFLCLFGALGNSLSIALFSLNGKYRRQSCSYYLSALAISDTGFLLNLFLIWYESMYGGVITSGFTCRLVMYLGQVTCFISVYVMVGFSIERYVAVRNPLSKQYICTKSRARKGIISVTCAALILFSYVWIIAQLIEIQPRQKKIKFRKINNSTGNYTTVSNTTTSVENMVQLFSTDEYFNTKHFLRFEFSNQTNPTLKVDYSRSKPLLHYCSVPKQYHHISKVANYLDTLITLIIPFMLILFCNVKIVLELQKLRKERQLFQSPPARLLVSSKTDTSVVHTVSKVKIETVKLRRCKSDGDIASKSSITTFNKLCKHGKMKERATITFPGVNSSHQITTEVKATKLLLMVSSIFLLLNLPLHLIRCAQFVRSLTISKEEKNVFGALHPWANLLFNTNFAVNFVLYCVSGENFRRAMKHTALTFLYKITGKEPAQLVTPPLWSLENKQKARTTKNICKIKNNLTRGGSLGILEPNIHGQSSRAGMIHAKTL